MYKAFCLCLKSDNSPDDVIVRHTDVIGVIGLDVQKTTF